MTSLASTWLDLVVGVDLHLELVPMPPPTPMPFPHPHCSVVFDPVGYIVGEITGALMAMGQPVEPAGPVLIGGRISTVTGDAASMPVKHILIAPGTAFAWGSPRATPSCSSAPRRCSCAARTRCVRERARGRARGRCGCRPRRGADLGRPGGHAHQRPPGENTRTAAKLHNPVAR